MNIDAWQAYDIGTSRIISAPLQRSARAIGRAVELGFKYLGF